MRLEETMSAMIEAAMNGASSGDGASSNDDQGLDEIIEFGRKALRVTRTEELALDLLALDGVWLPATVTRFTLTVGGRRMMGSRLSGPPAIYMEI